MGKMIKFSQLNLLKDALQYTSKQCTTDPEFVAMAHGVVVGVISVVMAQGKTFDQAVMVVATNLPVDFDKKTIPAAWYDQIMDCVNRTRK